MTVIDLLTADKSVQPGALGNGSDVGSEHHVEKSEIGLSLLHLFAAEFVGLRNIKHVRIRIASVATHGHYVGHKLVHGVDGAQLIAVRTVAKTALSCFLLC